MKGLIKKTDVVLIICLLLLAPLVWLVLPRSSAEGGIVVVRHAGEVLAEISLTEDGREFTFETSFGRNVLRVEDNAIRMVCADCPDGWCLRFAPIRQTRRTIVCLPNRLVVEVISGSLEEDIPDAFVY